MNKEIQFAIGELRAEIERVIGEKKLMSEELETLRASDRIKQANIELLEAENERLQNNLEASEAENEQLEDKLQEQLSTVGRLLEENAKLIAEREDNNAQKEHFNLSHLNIDEDAQEFEDFYRNRIDSLTRHPTMIVRQLSKHLQKAWAEREAMMKQEPIYQFTDDEKELWKVCNKSLYDVFPDENKRIVYRSPLPAQQIPEGYALVPIEPTDVMVEMGARNIFSYATIDRSAKEVYKAMLSAGQPKGESNELSEKERKAMTQQIIDDMNGLIEG